MLLLSDENEHSILNFSVGAILNLGTNVLRRMKLDAYQDHSLNQACGQCHSILFPHP